MRATGAVAGAEALARWTHPALGADPAQPASFRLAEDFGLIEAIGDCLSRCRPAAQLRRWDEAGYEVPHHGGEHLGHPVPQSRPDLRPSRKALAASTTSLRAG
jgi:EAL domain-containing protein (putative c-di-GMP-specific phosphodiesterase class I)